MAPSLHDSEIIQDCRLGMLRGSPRMNSQTACLILSMPCYSCSRRWNRSHYYHTLICAAIWNPSMYAFAIIACWNEVYWQLTCGHETKGAHTDAPSLATSLNISTWSLSITKADETRQISFGANLFSFQIPIVWNGTAAYAVDYHWQFTTYSSPR